MFNQKNDLLKIEQLYNSYRSLMYNEAYKILHESALAEDAVAEAIMRIIKCKHSFKLEHCPATRNFFATVCRNVAKTMYKKANHLQLTDIENLPSDLQTNMTSEDIIIDKESYQTLVQIIDNLPSAYRDVIMYKCVHGLKIEDIAVLTGLSVPTVYKRFERAKTKIKHQLEIERRKENE